MGARTRLFGPESVCGGGLEVDAVVMWARPSRRRWGVFVALEPAVDAGLNDSALLFGAGVGSPP